MSEIKDKVIHTIARILSREVIHPYTVTETILSIPQLAIVDRKAKLPNVPKEIAIGWEVPKRYYLQAQQDMLKVDWVKEIK